MLKKNKPSSQLDNLRGFFAKKNNKVKPKLEEPFDPDKTQPIPPYTKSVLTNQPFKQMVNGFAKHKLKINPLRLLGASIHWLLFPRLKLYTIDRYILSELWSHYLVGLFGFTIFMVITTIFILGEKILNFQLPPFTKIALLFLNIPNHLVLAIPVATLFATLMAMGRLQRDQELTVFACSGLSMYKLLMPFLSVAVWSSLLSFLIFDYVVPATNSRVDYIVNIMLDSQITEFIRPETVISAPDNRYFYIEVVNREDRTLENIRMYDYSRGDNSNTRRVIPRVFLADRGYLENKYLVLENVRIYETDPDDGNIIASAITNETKVDISTKLMNVTYRPQPGALSAIELKKRIKETEKDIEENPVLLQPFNRTSPIMKDYYYDQTEYFMRYSLPLASIVLVLIAVPLSLTGPRDERNLGVIISFVLVMLYYAFYFTFKQLGYEHSIPAVVAGWGPTAIFAVAAIFFLIRARK